VLVRHDVGLDAAAFDRLEEADFLFAIELQREVRCGI
jgi:hypothetical protein